jgi:hypothetical protein
MPGKQIKKRKPAKPAATEPSLGARVSDWVREKLKKAPPPPKNKRSGSDRLTPS